MGSKIKCPHCGKKTAQENIYCNKCGKKIPKEDSSAQNDGERKNSDPLYCQKCKSFIGVNDGGEAFPIYCIVCGCDFSKLPPSPKLIDSRPQLQPSATELLYCSRCGREVLKGNKFCDGCGCNFNECSPTPKPESVPPVEYCRICEKTVVKHRGDICSSCRENIVTPTQSLRPIPSPSPRSIPSPPPSPRPIPSPSSSVLEKNYCRKCNKNLVAVKGDLCIECKRESERSSKNDGMIGTGGDGFSQITGI